MILTETKWRSEWGIPDVGDKKYNVWMRNRRNKGGGGVMILTEKCVRVEKVIRNEDKSEILQVTVSSANGKTVNYVCAPKDECLGKRGA